ncbi:GlcG/HbpS family heme-binding protein [Pusillimonas sp.]|uniref:GlcG/HbpS family heme-binding protein n=1 Tax=Pusillimonas sp. TaxID=3040095 RepID=UPI0029AF836D|nr:heme-binding protein [Pusillimonas sp.]MDX3893608.1 heme-binding protein [Pusillimonas sp.]
MNTKKTLARADVQAVLDAAERHAKDNSWAVTIAVVDDGGHALGLVRLDGAAPMSADIALAKARTAAVSRRETKAFEDMINQGRYAFLSAPGIEGLMEGGVPIVVDGQAVGAVGVSGVKSPEDAAIARAGAGAVAS